MTIQQDLRDVADSLSRCRRRYPVTSETYQVMNWAVMRIHDLARQVEEAVRKEGRTATTELRQL